MLMGGLVFRQVPPATDVRGFRQGKGLEFSGHHGKEPGARWNCGPRMNRSGRGKIRSNSSADDLAEKTALIRESEERLRTFADVIPGRDRDLFRRKICRSKQPVFELFGVTVEELPNRRILDFIRRNCMRRCSDRWLPALTALRRS